MSRKVLAQHVQRGSSSALAALFGAWVQHLAQVQRVGWVDVATGAGLAALWLLGQGRK
jgi:hypothetical protein